jgi:3-methyl-2-oxobutanoate hydroxymethyltransferase
MRVSITQLQQMKKRGERIVMLTAYDYSTARLASDAGIPVILVGDSLGMVMLGYENTIPVTMAMMLHHTAAVVRGNPTSLIVGDMPFLSYRGPTDEALHNAGRFLQEAGAGAVKIEGADTLPAIRRMVAAGIPVMAHLGLTPQSVYQLGGWKAQGKTPAAAARMLDDALAVQDAGAFALVLETVPASLAQIISTRLQIPTIGIGAGPHCDGQVQVLHDLLGWYPDRVPKHARVYAPIGATIREAFQAYKADVQSGAFPGPAQTIDVDAGLFAGLAGGAGGPESVVGDTPVAAGSPPELADPEPRYGGAPEVPAGLPPAAPPARS